MENYKFKVWLFEYNHQSNDFCPYNFFKVLIDYWMLFMVQSDTLGLYSNYRLL